MSGITHLRSIAISAEDPTDLLRFYRDTWGLRPAGTTPDGGIMLRANGSEHHVLTLVPGTGHSMELISLGASSMDDVDVLAERLRASDVTILDGPGPRQGPGGGYAVTFTDPEGRTLEVSAGIEAAAEADGPVAGPDRLSHIVLNSVAVADSTKFYTDVLGFTLSDWYEKDQMIFLRCNSLHHCIVLAPGKWTSLNHVAFEVASADEVMKALGRMRKAGVDSIWGPGRHGPGGNVFCYFEDPAGNVIEYTAELLEVGSDWEPREWARSPENADVWGTGGGITPDVIAAMANPPVRRAP
jgi:catechol 2,3-dioxygenase-like lactoylglutathione lyase family enzyme